MARIVVTGSLNMDVVAVAPRIPVAGETIIGSKFFTSPGGKGANQAYAAARLGGSVAMLGRVGEDDFGRQMRQNLASVGCAIESVQAISGASGVALIYVSERGENSIVVVPGANDSLRPEDIGALDGCTVALLQLEIPIETVSTAARIARERGARVILDPAPAPQRALPRGLLASVDILTPNETEAAILTGSPPRRLSVDEARGVAAKLQALGPRTIILKMGEQGCLLATESQSVLIPAIAVNAVDTTAAGDIFNAALAVALSEGVELEQACRFATKAAAVSVTRLGAQSSAPTREEVEAFAAN
jgi:ribokinase